jgi:hypothetical protein
MKSWEGGKVEGKRERRGNSVETKLTDWRELKTSRWMEKDQDDLSLRERESWAGL